MKFIIKKNLLNDALKNINNIIDQNNTNPILTGVQIKSENNQLFLTCNNSSTRYQQIISDVNILEGGQILVKARVLYEIISSLKQDEITFTQVDESILHIQTPTYSSEINLLDNFSFPILKFEYQNWNKITLNSHTITNIYSKIKPFVSQVSSSQYTITKGILFNPIDEKNMEAIASDGVRIAYHKFDYTGSGIKFVADPEVIDFANSLLTISKNKTIDFYINDKNCALHVNNTTIIFILYDNNYPNINKALFTENKFFFTVKLNDLYSALNRGHPFVANDRNPAANLKVENNKLTLKFISPEIGNSFEEIEIIKSNIDNFEFKLNQKLFAELISSIDSETITFNFNNTQSPIIISSENPYFLNLIAPLRSI